jgi:Holliday junction resolvase RusA-like endonuclease
MSIVIDFTKPQITTLFPGKVQIAFTYHGAPCPKPRMTRSDRWNKRPAVVQYHSFKDCFRLAAQAAGYRDDLTIQEIRALAFIALPKSWPISRRKAMAGQPHTSKPDADNLLKAIADGLTTNDAGIWRVSLEKYWDDGRGQRLEIELICA